MDMVGPPLGLGWSVLVALASGIAMVVAGDDEATGGSTNAGSGPGAGLAAAGAAAGQEMPSGEAGAAAVPCSDPQEEEPGPGQFQFRIIDEDGDPLEAREPLEYRVYDASGSVVQEGMYDSGGTITVEADPSGRYALWLDGEYVTFHDETHDENGEP
jgi:hypothetical protein